MGLGQPRGVCPYVTLNLGRDTEQPVLFNTIEFCIFFVIVYGLYRVLDWRSQNRLLLVASYIFYGWWDLRFLFLIVISTVVDFCAGLLIGNGRITQSERRIASLYGVVAAFVFVTLQWRILQWDDGGLNLDFGAFLGDRFGWSVLGITTAILLLANYAYRWVAGLSEAQCRKLGLTLSMVTNLVILAFFKYCNFFVESAESTLQALGANVELLDLNIILPVGISFYTFQTMSYTIDVYRGKLQPTAKFWDFALFVVYFPQLVAGPIERATHLIPSLLNSRRITFKGTAHGLHLILIGLFKKVAIADGVATTVNQVYGSSGVVTSTDVAIATLVFAIQIYGDFSGYSDIARGVSSLFGIDLMLNFNVPYLSQNPQEFWRRWHISLSTWLRDYLYISLGGNRQSPSRTYVNLMLTMVLGGLWHGAAWNFVLWGFYQGLLLCGHRLWSRWRRPNPNPPTWRVVLNIIVCMVFVLYGWLLFRAESLAQVVDFTTKLLTFSGGSFGADIPDFSALVGIPILLFLDGCTYFGTDEYYYHRLPRPVQGGVYALMIFALLLGLSNASSDFIYFAF